jgi:hypothetical protein
MLTFLLFVTQQSQTRHSFQEMQLEVILFQTVKDYLWKYILIYFYSA